MMMNLSTGKENIAIEMNNYAINFRIYNMQGSLRLSFEEIDRMSSYDYKKLNEKLQYRYI